MTKKNWLLLTVALALGINYVVFFTDWFRPATLKIFHTMRTTRMRGQPAGASNFNLVFGLSRQVNITEITVVPRDAYLTNSKTLPLWHLVSDSNSVPVKGFTYGQNIRGLKPAVPGSRPQALATNLVYRLLLEAGKLRGEHDFELR